MKFSPLVVAGLAIALGACHRAPQTAANSALLQVGGESITEADLTLEVKDLTGSAAREEALQRVTERKRMVAEARATGLADDPAVRRAIDGVLIRFLQERRLQPQIDALAVDEKELAAQFEASTAAHPAATELTVAILFRASHPADLARRKAHREQFEAIAASISSVPAASGFGARAVEASEHAESRFQGGILPPLALGSTYHDFRDALLAACQTLAPGETSTPLETPDGLYLVRVIERRPGRVPTFADSKERLRREALRAREEDIRRAFAAELAEKYPARTTSSL